MSRNASSRHTSSGWGRRDIISETPAGEGESSCFSEEQLLHVCADFYAAGMETTATTLRWCILYLAQYQVVQDKMRKEIEEAVGHGRLPSMGDKTRMPYTR